MIRENREEIHEETIKVHRIRFTLITKTYLPTCLIDLFSRKARINFLRWHTEKLSIRSSVSAQNNDLSAMATVRRFFFHTSILLIRDRENVQPFFRSISAIRYCQFFLGLYEIPRRFARVIHTWRKRKRSAWYRADFLYDNN